MGLRTTFDIASEEFREDGIDVQSRLDIYANQIFDGMRLMRLSEKLFLLKEIEVDVKNGIAKLPPDFYKEWNGEEDLYDRSNLARNAFFGFKNELRYDITACLLKSNIQDGRVEFIYYAIPTDEENGYPLVTEAHGIDIAIKLYLRYRHVSALYNAGKVGIERKQSAYKDWIETAADVRGDAKMPSPYKMRRILDRYNKRGI